MGGDIRVGDEDGLRGIRENIALFFLIRLCFKLAKDLKKEKCNTRRD